MTIRLLPAKTFLMPCSMGCSGELEAHPLAASSAEMQRWKMHFS